MKLPDLFEIYDLLSEFHVCVQKSWNSPGCWEKSEKLQNEKFWNFWNLLKFQTWNFREFSWSAETLRAWTKSGLRILTECNLGASASCLIQKSNFISDFVRISESCSMPYWMSSYACSSSSLATWAQSPLREGRELFSVTNYFCDVHDHQSRLSHFYQLLTERVNGIITSTEKNYF